ncbi:MAG: glycine betaine ABC transporter substrate-binding protein [Candidatus Aerophobetes bacterium]|nr:glycine betaine ABC transporter substrate-binding protein [Candidatus Aerophobetes bacterium]
MRKLLSLVVAVMIVFGMSGTYLLAAEKPTIVVGNKNFTEEYIAGQLMKQILENRGFKVELKSDLSSMIMRKGMETKNIDVCMEYTGTAWMVHLARPYTPTGHEELYYMTKAADAKNGLIWLQPIWNHNSYALAVWPEFAKENNIETLSDLAAFCNQKKGKVKTFIDFEFSQRPDGWPAVQKTYNFTVDSDYLKTAAPGASLIALAKHDVDVAMVFATDASIAKYGWVVLRDDKYFFPPYDLTPYVRAEILEKYPEVGIALNELVAAFSNASGVPYTKEKLSNAQRMWQWLNGKVDIEKKDAAEAAHDFLVEHNL